VIGRPIYDNYSRVGVSEGNLCIKLHDNAFYNSKWGNILLVKVSDIINTNFKIIKFFIIKVLLSLFN
jgi:hypothetical protein